ncbi:MAG: riboflavin synthase [Longimicrobiales bacterium]
MFTGIVEETGTIASAERTSDAMRMRIECATVLDGLRAGASIAVDGVCQTVVSLDPHGFAVNTIATTLERTTLGHLRTGDAVNLERALALGDRLGGHLVQGHVDGVGRVRAIERKGEHVLLDVELPQVVADVTVLHGSIAVQGVSLTVNALPAPDVAQVALIPFTWDHTTLRSLEPGSPVNLEGDLLGRFVVHWLMRRSAGGVVPPA